MHIPFCRHMKHVTTINRMLIKYNAIIRYDNTLIIIFVDVFLSLIKTLIN